MVEIFKTNVQKKSDSNYIISIIKQQFPDCKINFDLEDCDRILRIEGGRFNPKQIIEHLNLQGYICVPLE
jgi:hypothetical protein